MKTEAPASNPLMRMNRPAVNHFDRNEQTNDIFIKQLIAALGAIAEGDFPRGCRRIGGARKGAWPTN